MLKIVKIQMQAVFIHLLHVPPTQYKYDYDKHTEESKEKGREHETVRGHFKGIV